MVRLPLAPDEVVRGRRLGARLRQARGERSILETALDARVSPETLRKIESGRVATPAFPTIAAIADVLGLSIAEVGARVSAAEPSRKRQAARSPPAAGAADARRTPRLTGEADGEREGGEQLRTNAHSE